jgi:hypothetical protein
MRHTTIFSPRVPELLAKNTAGIPYLRYVVQRALDELEREGTVSEKTCDLLGVHFSKMPYNPAEELRIWFVGEIPEGEDDDLDSDDEPAPAADLGEADKKAAARQYLETVFKDLDGREQKLRKQERTDLEIAQQQLSIPKGPNSNASSVTGPQSSATCTGPSINSSVCSAGARAPPPPTVNVNVSNDD